MLVESLKDAISVNTLYSTDKFFAGIQSRRQLQFMAETVILSQVQMQSEF